MKTRHAILTAIIGFSALAGCGGGDKSVKVQETTTITIGQEMLDLQRAQKEGAVTSVEYEAIRRALLRRYK